MFRAKKRARAHLDITFQVDVFRGKILRDHFVYDRFFCVKFCDAKLRIRFAHAKTLEHLEGSFPSTFSVASLDLLVEIKKQS